MPDSSAILNWIQSGGVLAALIFTALEVRARRKEQHFRNYWEGIAGFIEDTRLLVENKALFGLYNYSPQDITKQYEELSDDQKARVHYCDSIIARCETVWLGSKDGSIPKDEWRYWKDWIRQLAGSADFRWTVNWVAVDYDEEFIAIVNEEVKQAISELASSRTAAPTN